ncbi:hypothetical protein [Pseudobacteriovorax antillogorgiicola]|uniref:Polyamine aminopropyltransferase n=1 Tax=Pseudobacteriovorax antillogorgiicola TaxID=1513793 RepID=A0A1Y6C182_9BACT|nr:hypothetical protein [Pseudobacteriovorax antillogorgiicola]TCS51128.1 spermidine synthase [Pseudobacteriovorax antillogorgiicola]SMF38512.1 spermidine synthase [Pseudobacteriovorax antillogorgiicola]
MNSSRKVYGLAMLLSVCSFLYELSIAKIFSDLLGNFILWQSVTIAVYIGGLSFGAFLSDTKRFAHSRVRFLKVELMLSILGPLVPLFLLAGHIIYRIYFNDAMIDVLETSDFLTIQQVKESRWLPWVTYVLLGQGLTLAIGTLSGFEIPYLIQSLKGKGNHSLMVLGFNYFGSLLASLAFSFWLLPQVSAVYTCLFAGVLNLICAVFIAEEKSRKWVAFPSFCLIVCAFLYQPTYKANRHVFYYYFYKYLPEQVSMSELPRFLSFLPPIEERQTLYQKLEFASLPLQDEPHTNGLFIDGHFQFDSSSERSYHEAMSRLPHLIALMKPKAPLILGGGDGLLARDLIKELDQSTIIEHVELDEGMYEFSRNSEQMIGLNEGSLSSDRIHTSFVDAFSFIKNSSKYYDGIYIDFPYPYSYDVLKLYSVEFYRMLFKRMSKESFAVLDIPLVNSSSPHSGANGFQHNSIIMSTLHEVGFSHLIPYAVGDESFIFAYKGERSLRQLDPTMGTELAHISMEVWSQTLDAEFSFEIDSQYVNSIFKPTLLSFRDDFF